MLNDSSKGANRFVVFVVVVLLKEKISNLKTKYKYLYLARATSDEELLKNYE
jgi:hypothetical protein